MESDILTDQVVEEGDGDGSGMPPVAGGEQAH